MAKFNIEVELDWLDEEENIDEVLKEEIISSLRTKITADATKEITESLSGIIQENAEKIIDNFLEETLKNKLEDMKIPYQKSSWDSKVEYIPLSQFIGMRYETYLNKRTLDENGNEPRYNGDRKLSINEYFINKYLEKELTSKVSNLIQTARKDAEETIIKTLEQNLKDQLSIDIIKRLDIPNMLKNLQDKAKLLEESKQS